MAPEWVWTVEIVLEGYKLFCSGANCFGQIQIILIRFKLVFYRTFLIIWTCPKWFWIQPKRIGPAQNYWYSTKMIWTVQNDFGPIEGQGIIMLHSINVLKILRKWLSTHVKEKRMISFYIWNSLGQNSELWF